MREIMTVIKGNFRKNKSAYISIAVLMFVVSLALVAVFSILVNTGKRDREAMEEVGFGDIIAAIRYDDSDMKYQELCEKIAKDLEACPEVSHVDMIPSLFMDITELNGKESQSSIFVYDYQSPYISYNIYDADNRRIEQPILNEGEVCVPVCFQSLYNCKIGDVVTLQYGDKEYQYRIVSYLEDPYMGSSMMGIKTLLLNGNDMEKVLSEAEAFKENCITLSIFKSEESRLNDVEFERELNRATSYASYSWITLTRSQAYNYMTMLTNICSGILIGFIVMLVVATMVVLSHNISSSIEQDYVNLGILKAVGMTSRKLRSSIMLGYLIAAFFGACLGIPASIPVITVINRLTRPTTGLYVENVPAFLVSSLAIAAILMILVLFIFLKLRGLSYITPVSAINGGKKDVHFSSLFRLPISKRALGTSLAYRQLTSGKKQYIGAVIVTAILVMFMTMITDMCIWFGNDGERLREMFDTVQYDMVVWTVDEETREEVDALVAECTDYEKFLFGSQYVLMNDTQIWCGMTNEPERYETVYNGRTCLYDNEILITEYVAENYGIGIGDSIEIELGGNRAEYIVSGYYQCSNDSGKNICMNLEGYEKLAGELTYNRYCYKLADKNKADDIVSAITEKYGEEQAVAGKSGVFDGMSIIVNAVNGIALIIYMLAAVFIVVTVILVCGKIFAREKQNYGIYKAIGFTSARLRSQFAVRFMIASLIGSAIGIVLTLLFSDMIVGAIFSTFGITNFSSSLNVQAAVIPVLFMALVYYGFSYLVSKRMKRVTPRVLISE